MRNRRLLRRGIIALCAAVVILLAGCATPGFHAAVGTASEYRLVQYPDAGFAGVYAQTAAATSSIDMEMYELADPHEETLLISAHQRRVAVRVLLDSKYEEKAANQPAFDKLASAGVAVRWASGSEIFHTKVTTFDRATSDISTANLTSRYYATTRDAEIVDTNPTQVDAIEHTFDSDWGGGLPTDGEQDAPGLVWSPDAESTMVDLIHSAKSSVRFTSEELSDPYIVNALADDARRGVTCEIAMVYDPEWRAAFSKVTAAGCAVHVVPNTQNGFYIHEKLVLVDAGAPGAVVLLGSQNATYASLSFNRELGILLTGAVTPGIVAAIGATFDKDFATAKPWQG